MLVDVIMHDLLLIHHDLFNTNRDDSTLRIKDVHSKHT